MKLFDYYTITLFDLKSIQNNVKYSVSSINYLKILYLLNLYIAYIFSNYIHVYYL